MFKFPGSQTKPLQERAAFGGDDPLDESLLPGKPDDPKR